MKLNESGKFGDRKRRSKFGEKPHPVLFESSQQRVVFLEARWIAEDLHLRRDMVLHVFVRRPESDGCEDQDAIREMIETVINRQMFERVEREVGLIRMGPQVPRDQALLVNPGENGSATDRGRIVGIAEISGDIR